MAEAVEALAGLGWELVDVDLPELDVVDETLGTVVLREAWDVHRTRYEARGRRVRSRHPRAARARLPIGDDAYRQGLADQARVAAAFARLFGDVDVLVGPTVAYVAPPEDPPFGAPEGELEGRYTSPYNLSGSPAVSIPCGIAEGTLPAGLQLAADVGADALLLSAAHLVEEALR